MGTWSLQGLPPRKRPGPGSLRSLEIEMERAGCLVVLNAGPGSNSVPPQDLPVVPESSELSPMSASMELVLSRRLP